MYRRAQFRVRPADDRGRAQHRLGLAGQGVHAGVEQLVEGGRKQCGMAWVLHGLHDELLGEQRILLGERTPTGGDLYARLPDEKRVFLVSSFLDSTFNKDTFALREKSVITVDRDKVDRIEVKAGERSVTLAKTGAEWRIEAPLMARADFAAVEGALERLSSARMQGIVAPEAEALAQYKLDPPVATFTAIAGSARAQTTAKTASSLHAALATK